MEIEANFSKKVKKQRRRGDNGRRLLINRAALSMRKERQSQGMPGETGAVQEDLWGGVLCGLLLSRCGATLRSPMEAKEWGRAAGRDDMRGGVL